MQIIKKAPGVQKGPLIIYDDIEPVDYEIKPPKKTVAIFDTETDPFEAGRIVKPFTCGFHIPHLNFYKDFWGANCIHQFFKWLRVVTRPGQQFEGMQFQILVHNGGNFDFYFFVDYFDAGHTPFIINGRLVRIMAQGQEFRDSYAMIPVPLGQYDKIVIKNGVRDTTIPIEKDKWYNELKADYDMLQVWAVSCVKTRKETIVREFFKDEIRIYQKRDCTSLGELVVAWYDMFGDRLTMASVALPMLRSFVGFEQMDERTDADLRPYYFGGRNQCFATGVMRGRFKIYDINSSYPDVMRRYQHPISDTPRIEAVISERTCFAHIRAWSLGALPIRKPDGSLAFPIGTHDFFACIHEIRAGLETKTLRIIKVYSSIYFDESANFADFIDHFYALRMEASAKGDEILKLFYKLVMNSSYGKFAQDPRKYKNWLFNPDAPPTPTYCDRCFQAIRRREPKDECETCDTDQSSPFGWRPATSRDGYTIYAAPQSVRGGSFYNVATAASITSAARASVLYGIQAATRPIYCDTDSLICEDLAPNANITIDEKQLGAWKCEAEADQVCIAGKKLYVLFQDGKEVKKASKGVKLTAQEIYRVCQGEVIEYAHPVPKFSLDANPTMEFIADDYAKKLWTKRKIRMTA